MKKEITKLLSIIRNIDLIELIILIIKVPFNILFYIIGFLIGYIMNLKIFLKKGIRKIEDIFHYKFSIIFREEYFANRKEPGILITYDGWRDGPRSGLCIHNFKIYRYGMDEDINQEVIDYKKSEKICGCTFCDCSKIEIDYNYFIEEKSNEYTCNECGLKIHTMRKDNPSYCYNCKKETIFSKSI